MDQTLSAASEPLRRFHDVHAGLPPLSWSVPGIDMLVAAAIAGARDASKNTLEHARVAAELIAERRNEWTYALTWLLGGVLAYTGTPADGFLTLCERAHRRLSALGSETDPECEALTSAVLLLQTGVVSDADLVAVAALAERLRQRLWWGVGHFEMPAAAVLVRQAMEPTTVLEGIEAQVQELLERGFAGGTPLQLAVVLLATAPDGSERAFGRFLGLACALGAQAPAPALAMLSLAAHDQRHAVEAFQTMAAHLEPQFGQDAQLPGAVVAMLAAMELSSQAGAATAHFIGSRLCDTMESGLCLAGAMALCHHHPEVRA